MQLPVARCQPGVTRWHLRAASRVLRAGGVVAYPTEAVYGLGCDPFDVAAIARLLAMKGRRPEKGLILIAADFAQVAALVEEPDGAVRGRVAAVSYFCAAARKRGSKM